MHGCGVHPPKHGNPTSGHILREWFSLPKLCPLTIAPQYRVELGASSTPCIIRFSLIWSCAVAMAAVSSWVQWHGMSPKQHPTASTLPCLPVCRFFPLFLRWSLRLECSVLDQISVLTPPPPRLRDRCYSWLMSFSGSALEAMMASFGT